MINNINKEENEDSFISNKKWINLTNLDELSNNQNSKSKLVLKEFNYSYSKSIKKKFKSKKNLLKCKILPNISIEENNNYFPSVNFHNNFHNIGPNMFSSNILSKSQNSLTMKSIEKDLQQKIINISMKIEEESSIIGVQNNNFKLSTLILGKINIDNKDNKSIFSPTHKKKVQNSPINKNNLNKFEKKDICLSPIKNHFIPKFTKTIKNNKNNKNAFRFLLKKKLIYDSFDSDEEDELEGIFISPDNYFIQFIDLLIIISSLFNMIYTPYFMSNIKSLCAPKTECIKYIYFLIDILYTIDLILGFFRAHHNYQFQIIKRNKEIIKHYLFTQFFLDLIQAIPFFSYLIYIHDKNQINNYETYNIRNSDLFLILSCYIKVLKFFKIIDIKKNSVYNEIKQKISNNDNLEKLFSFIIYFCLCIFGFYFFISIHILIGRSSYPNWITNSGFQNENLFSLYLISFYYLITTMTTVGYGNIVCASTFREYFFQLILLSAGITVYSWIVSNVGNYVKNESNASIRFNKDEAILEEIRILYPNMPFSLYKKIYHHLGLRKIRQRQCDSNILINSLPHSLKNQIIFAMHEQTIKNFKIFKGNQNTDFTIRLLTNFIPLISKKNAFLIHEGQLINNIIFVQEGRLSLEACIDTEEPYKSVKQYISKNFCDIFEDVVIVSDYESSIDASKLTENNYNNIFKKAKDELNSVLNDKNKTDQGSSINESIIIKEIGKWDFGGENWETNKYQFLNIINISKNESFGDVYMFLCKPSPLSLRVKSKIAELFLLRRIDASDISSRYPNIWAKFFKKSYKNMLSIKKIAIQKIKYYWKNLGKHKHKNKNKKNKVDDSIEKEKNEKPTMMRSIVPKICISNNIDKNTDCKNTFIFENNQNKNTLVGNNNIKNTDTMKYISFGKESSKHLDKKIRSCYSPKKMKFGTGDIKKNNKQKLNTAFQNNKLKLSKFRSECKTIKNDNKELEKVLTRNKSVKDLRLNYLKKLNRKIKKLKTSKKYYKDLCKKIKYNSQKNSSKTLNSFKDKINNKNKNELNNINININFNNNNVILDKAEFNISKSSNNSNSNSSSNSKFINNLSITSPINLTYQAKYKNLDKYTFGEYSKNRNLRIIVKKFIQFYLSSFTIKKKEKIFDVNLSSIYPLKSTNVDYGFTSYPSLYSETKKLNIPKKNASNSSLNKCLSKKIGNNSNEGQYLIIFNSNNNSFNFLGKNIKKRLSVPGYNIKNTNELWINNFKENFAYKNDLFYKNFSKINEFSNKINNNEILFCDNEKEFNSVYNNNKLINKTFET